MEKIPSRKERLFNLYAQNLANLKRHPDVHMVPDVNDAFICPLCSNFFTREALLESQDITVEHVPPDSLGGNTYTLLCGECNHSTGTTLVSALKKELHAKDFEDRVVGASLDVRYSPSPMIWLPASVSFAHDQSLVLRGDLNPKRSSPQARKKLKELQLSKQISDVTFMHKRPGRLRVNIALLYVAYLQAFRKFGYGYVISPQAQQVREQIRNPTAEILPRAWTLDNFVFPEECVGINLMVEPRELRSFLVILCFKTASRTVLRAVLLPSPLSPGLSVYEWLDEQNRAGSQIKLRYGHIPEEVEFLTQPEHSFAAYALWENIS
jgi:HNH endonuclease